MNDMTQTILAKSDQINAADLIGNPRTITIREVRIKAGEDQPVSVLIEGDTKAFRPCKGVRRLMVRVWGPDANKYIGQSMTIFCDPKVTWAGKEEGGIRVSHMTGLDEKIVEFMRTSRAATKPYEIMPLTVGKPATAGNSLTPEQLRAKAEGWVREHTVAVEACDSLEALDALIAKGKAAVAKLDRDHADLRDIVMDAYSAKGEAPEAAIANAGQPEADTGDWEA